MRNQGFFLVFMLCLTLGLVISYRVFEDHYSDRHDLQAQIVRLEEKAQRQNLQQALLLNQVEDLKAQVFEELGSKKALAWNQKQWVSALRAPASEGGQGLSSDLLLSESKESFVRKNYGEAIAQLKTLIEKFPASPRVVEAHFLLAESYFLSNQVELSLDTIDQMMTQFPESELTGFIMLRMGQVLESKKRQGEAQEVYSTILRQFPRSAELREQTQKLIKKSL